MTPEEYAAMPWGELRLSPIYHGDAQILGTRSFLEGLQAAIGRALASGEDQHAEAFASDGEGYHLLVRVMPSVEAIEAQPGTHYVCEIAD